MSKPRLACLIGIVVMLGTPPAWADPDAKRECAASYERAQRLRRETKLVAAKRSLVACVQEECPPLLRTDCAAWLKEVDTALPTIVLEVTNEAGDAVVEVDVVMDGSPLVSRLDGRAIEVDPGVHALYLRSGDLEASLSVVAREGEKLRRVKITLPKRTPASSAPAPASVRSEPRARPWALTIGLGAVGVLGLGSFAAFGLSGRGSENTLEACRPSCAHDDVQDVRTKYLVADVSLAVGTLALGAAAVVWFLAGERR